MTRKPISIDRWSSFTSITFRLTCLKKWTIVTKNSKLMMWCHLQLVVVLFLPVLALSHFTMVQNNQEPRLKYWVTGSSVCSFARTAHSFACSALLALLARSAYFAHSLACGTANDYMAILSVFFFHFGPKCIAKPVPRTTLNLSVT